MCWASALRRSSVYKLIGGAMFFGNMKFRQKPREGQAEVDTKEGRRWAGAT